eukprot:1856532-Prymnesium_polylepis.1
MACTRTCTATTSTAATTAIATTATTATAAAAAAITQSACVAADHALALGVCVRPASGKAA